MSRYFSKQFKDLEPYVPGEQPQDKKYIKLNTNESPFPPSPMAQRLARQAAGDVQLYSDPDCKELIAAAAESFGIEKDEIMFVNGSDDVINFAFMAFCDEETPAVFPDVTYGFYSVIANLHHIPYEEIPVNEDFTINVSDYMNAGKTVFIANPNAQTGIALPACEIEKIIASNPDNVVVVDEAYVDFGGESVLPLIHKYDNLLVCQTLSKSRSLAGARLGFGAACKELINDLNTLRYSTNPYNVNRMTSAAGVGAICDKAYFEENCEKIKKTRKWTRDRLTDLGFEVTDSSANFLLAKSDKIGGQELYLTLKDRGILIRHFETQRLKDYNRITIGSDEQMQAFIDAVEKILEEKK